MVLHEYGRRFRTLSLSSGMDRLPSSQLTPDDVAIQADAIQRDTDLFSRFQAATICTCRRCQDLATKTRGRYYPPQATLLGITPPNWSQWVNSQKGGNKAT